MRYTPFKSLCDMFGVDIAIETAKNLGMSITDEEIEVARDSESEEINRLDRLFDFGNKEENEE